MQHFYKQVVINLLTRMPGSAALQFQKICVTYYAISKHHVNKSYEHLKFQKLI